VSRSPHFARRVCRVRLDRPLHVADAVTDQKE
jgi:hypothetical protein